MQRREINISETNEEAVAELERWVGVTYGGRPVPEAIGSLRCKRQRRRHNMRRRLFDRDGSACCHCGRPLDWESATFEHVVPKSRGGAFSLENLRLSCFDCNNERGDADFATFSAGKKAP